jgi:eukaryotic-like serine/threonine-protein kinase
MGRDGLPKLDFTGVAVGFPAEPGRIEASERADQATDAIEMADRRAADLYNFGELLDWLAHIGTERTQRVSAATSLDFQSAIRELAAKLRAADPADRPTAREVAEWLERLSQPMNVTGHWGDTAELGTEVATFARTDGQKSIATARSIRGAPPAASEVLLGRYRLLEKLGEGGQGVVYRAFDPADGSVVAIKVLRTDRSASTSVLRRFRKEARLMAELNNPNVVNLREYNEEDGDPYIVLEFVAGVSLARLLDEQGPLPTKTAVAIMAGVARGLAEAHERGIVHRDIKPSNILLVESRTEESTKSPDTSVMNADVDLGETVERPPPAVAVALPSTVPEASANHLESPQVKILDFGLARHVIDSESLAMTAAGALLGTPHYMAPEQWTGRLVDPRTDIYAMGATLYQLLTGRPPFSAETRDDLCMQHCNEPPPSLLTFNRTIDEGVARIAERALSKRPEDRYVDARAMLRELEALLRGEAVDVAIHPKLPACGAGRTMQYEFRWELASSPRQLWPLVTDTDRVNRAIGFEPVQYSTRYEPEHGVRTYALGRKAGTVEFGEEHPYEWIEPRRMGILREYSEGPFRWVVSTIELIALAGGGTTLIHRLWLEPSSWVIRVGSHFGVGVRMRKSLEKVYKRIDATLQARAGRASHTAVVVDPFEEADRLSAPRRQRLERLLDRLADRGVDEDIIERLGEFITHASAQEVARIRPIALAERLALDPDAMIAACLHGAREGLLELHWDLLCPVCRISCQVTDTLRAIAEHAHCAACNFDFRLDFANSIELIFRVHPEIRSADVGTYCIGGPAHSPHVPAQLRLAAGERLELELELSQGAYRLRGPQLPWSADFQVQAGASSRRWEIDLTSAPAASDHPVLRAGGQLLTIFNPQPRELVVRIERTASHADALTAARAASLALFRELFPGEVLAPGQLATVSTITFVVTALNRAQADAIYRELGDARAFGVIHEHFQLLGEAIRRHGGAVVKTQGEGMVASFSNVTAAVQAALGLPGALLAAESTRTLRLRIGVHRGPALAATLNDQLDYFGATARQAAATLEHAGDGALVLTQPVAADPEVAALLHERRVAAEVVPAAFGEYNHVIRVRLGSPVETQ